MNGIHSFPSRPLPLPIYEGEGKYVVRIARRDAEKV